MQSPYDQVLNLLIPGSGLIVRRREWLGFSLSLVFGISGNIALAGWLIAPEAMPGWLVRAAMAMTAGSWILAQILFWRHGVVIRRHAEVAHSAATADKPHHLQSLVRTARQNGC